MQLSRTNLCLVLLLTGFAVDAADNYFTANVQRASVEFTRNNIFLLETPMRVVVTGPGSYLFEQTFLPSEVIALKIVDNNGLTLLDGEYSFEITSVNEFNSRQSTPLDLEGKTTDSFHQSGTLSVASGRWVSPDVTEGASGRDQVINDDLIINGSLCAGTDCATNEPFEFDTIRLKENNLRIRFVDTSNSSSFPTTDWELRANDTTNGGANKFSIADLDNNRDIFSVEGAAPTNSLYVDDRGRVGFGTSTPVLDQHILSGNTPAIRFEQNGSGGFPSQTWDTGGNETEFFIRDSSNASVPVRVLPGAPSNSLVVNSAGDIEIGGTIISNPVINLPNAKLTARGQSQLPALAEVEQHISRFQQLPGVESQADDLVQLQLQLLEKIQELTLYAIEQDKRIAELEAKLNAK